MELGGATLLFLDRSQALPALHVRFDEVGLCSGGRKFRIVAQYQIRALRPVTLNERGLFESAFARLCELLGLWQTNQIHLFALR